MYKNFNLAIFEPAPVRNCSIDLTTKPYHLIKLSCQACKFLHAC